MSEPETTRTPMPTTTLPTTPLVRFNLTRWFAVAALVTITLLAVAMGALLNRFITQPLLWQQAVLTSECVHSLVLPEKTPLANLHLTMLEKLGIPQPSFGNSTGLLSEV